MHLPLKGGTVSAVFWFASLLLGLLFTSPVDTVLDLLPSIVPGPVLLPSPLSILANLAANLSFISFSKAWQSAIEAALSASLAELATSWWLKLVLLPVPPLRLH
uniref:hypothetical protein n=1 Tax=Rigidoporus microporus TaxID=219653 RepID=UPI002E77AAF9|nr:hypothetical protein V2420_mgp19 [Rigidoporus microporus]WPS66292.1 hypothetical protein [Rigidoporus microporus]